jgi:transcription elongation factor Elf1
MTTCKTCGSQWDEDTLLKAGGRFGNAHCQACGYDPQLHEMHSRAVWTEEDVEYGYGRQR